MQCDAARVNKLKFVPELEKTGREYFRINAKKMESVIFGVCTVRTLIRCGVCIRSFKSAVDSSHLNNK